MSPGLPGFGGQGYQGPETRTLRSISQGDQKRPASSEDMARMLQAHESKIQYLAADNKRLHKGVNEATQNPLQQIQQFIADIAVLLGGGQLVSGALDYGDLQYILPAIGALFGFGDSPFPLNLIAAAEKFFFGYVVPTQAFADLINKFIENWLTALGINKKFIKDLKDLVSSVGELFDGLTGLLPNVNALFTALEITASGLGPLGLALAPILKLFKGIDLSAFGNAVEFITSSMDPHIVGLTKVINFVNALLRIFGSQQFDVVNSPLPQLTQPFVNLVAFLGGINLAVTSFNPIAAAQQFLARLTIPVGSISEVQPNLQLDPGFDEASSIAEDSPAWAPEDLDALIDYPEGWVWDLVGRNASGSVTVVCDGADHAIRGTVIPVEAGQTLIVDAWAAWADVTAVGGAFSLQILTDASDIITLQTIASPAADGAWTHLGANYTVPADVDTIRIRLYVSSIATAGQVWFDDATIRRSNILKKTFIGGLVEDLTELFGNFAAILDATLGTGHTFAQVAVYIGAGLNLAGNAIEMINELLSGIAGGLPNMAQLAAFLNNTNDGMIAAANEIGDLLSGAGEATMASLGALISELLTMINQISDIFNGNIVTPINAAVQQIKDWVAANINYLANIPNTAVQGLVGFGNNIGASLQAGFDGVWQGLRLFLGVPSGIGPPQVAAAGQQVRVDLNNATDIATAAAAFQAKQSISKQSFLSIDPSADPVFPLANINGASPSTVSVTAVKSVMGVVGLPDNSLKKSIVWLGGPLTNITAVYVNLYKVNTTTGEFTRTHQSANIVGALANPVSGVAWNFYNLPMADYFPAVQGDWYVAEIQVVGPGTYDVVGVSNAWMPNHPSVYPKGLGATRGPAAPVFKSVGAGINVASAAAGTKSWSHTIDSDADCLILAINTGIAAGGSPAVNNAVVGSTPMTLLSSNQYLAGSPNYSFVQLYGLLNPPTGSQTISIDVSGGSSVNVAANSIAYKGVSGFGTAQTTTGNGTSMSHTVTSGATNQTIVQAFGDVGLAISAYNRTSRHLSNSPFAVQAGDAAGAASVAFTATHTSGSFNQWGSAAVPLLGVVPSGPSSIASPSYDPATPWIALAGAAGRTQHLPETVEFETAGAGQTYTVPAWVIDGDYIDIVPIGAGAGGSYMGESYTTFNPTSYKGGGSGSWNPIRLRYGDDYDIPTGTTTFTINVGSGGTGAAHTHPTHTPALGSDGGNTTVVITGYPTITANGGTKNSSTRVGSFGHEDGDTPGNVVHEGVTYFGGAIASNNAKVVVTGQSPGGGGAAGFSSHSGSNPLTNWDTSGGAGGPGACYITAVQN